MEARRNKKIDHGRLANLANPSPRGPAAKRVGSTGKRSPVVSKPTSPGGVRGGEEEEEEEMEQEAERSANIFVLSDDKEAVPLGQMQAAVAMPAAQPPAPEPEPEPEAEPEAAAAAETDEGTQPDAEAVATTDTPAEVDAEVDAAEEAAAATKLQAMERGRQDRAAVAAMKAAETQDADGLETGAEPEAEAAQPEELQPEPEPEPEPESEPDQTDNAADADGAAAAEQEQKQEQQEENEKLAAYVDTPDAEQCRRAFQTRLSRRAEGTFNVPGLFERLDGIDDAITSDEFGEPSFLPLSLSVSLSLAVVPPLPMMMTMMMTMMMMMMMHSFHTKLC